MNDTIENIRRALENFDLIGEYTSWEYDDLRYLLGLIESVCDVACDADRGPRHRCPIAYGKHGPKYPSEETEIRPREEKCREYWGRMREEGLWVDGEGWTDKAMREWNK